MTISHLLNSRVAVSRLSSITSEGRVSWVWTDVPELAYVRVRLDLNFLRPGKDAPMPVEAGKAPDRIGVCFYEADAGLKSGDRIRAVTNDIGQLPVPGTFEMKQVPDVAQDYSGGHHCEVQITEVSQAFVDAARPFPGSA